MRQWEQLARKLPPGLPNLPRAQAWDPSLALSPPDTWVQVAQREVQAPPTLPTMEQTSVAALSLLALHARQCTWL